MNMKLAILGGTFDPPHIGHFFIADTVTVELGYDLVLFIPSNIPAHKRVESKVSPEERLEMLETAIEGNPRFGLDDCELRRGGISYSIDTVREIAGRYKGISGKPGLIIGDDLVDGFPSWKESKALPYEADILVAKRTETGRSDLSFSHTNLGNIRIPVSSTEIRERIRKKQAFRYLVNEKIYSYIREKHLYVY